MIDDRTRRSALRGLLWGLLVAWLAKWDLFVLGAKVYLHRPLTDSFFPAPLQSFGVLAALLCAPIAFGLFALLRDHAATWGASLLVFVLGSCGLMLHQGSYNDATFVTSFWVALIGVWLYVKSARPDAELAQRLAFLTQLLLGMLFFGGVVGKLTPGYFDGSVFFGIYFEDRDHFTFNFLREHLDTTQLRAAATAYSWLALTIECLLATLPLWSTRPALRFALIALSSLVVLNNFRLLSVVASLGALAATSLYLLRKSARDEGNSLAA